MSLPWFNLLAKLAYFRYNYRHFHCKSSPAWTEEDSLLAERLDDIRAGLVPDSGCGERAQTLATKTILLQIPYSHMKVYVDIQMRVMPAFSFSVFKGVPSSRACLSDTW